MSKRPLDDYAHERQTLDAAHAQNEASRDTFVALAHTALFAASVSFVGDVTPLAEAIWKPMLIVGWSADVIGLLALTLSFGAARRSIDARRAALNEPVPPAGRQTDLLNGIALWSFPVALLCLFSFVTANVVHSDERKVQSSTSTRQVWSDAAGKSAGARDAGGRSPTKGAEPRRTIKPVDGHRTAAARTLGATAIAPASTDQKVVEGKKS